jgi:hypothetical protein
MKTPRRWFDEYLSDTHSQFGEDGIVQELLRRLGVERGGVCVEFGAWDGNHLSNTKLLFTTRDYSGLLIECNRERYEHLVQNYKKFPRVVCVNARVGFEGAERLDAILRNHNIPKVFDLLSIDVDGTDYHIWKSLNDFRPKVVVIEFNPTIPNSEIFVQPADSRISQGSSLKAMHELGEQKGYVLVAVTRINAFFVDRCLVNQLGPIASGIESVRPVNPDETIFFQLFDGTIVIKGCTNLLWDDVPLSNGVMQIKPKLLRRHSASGSRIWQVATLIWRFYRRMFRAE